MNIYKLISSLLLIITFSISSQIESDAQILSKIFKKTLKESTEKVTKKGIVKTSKEISETIAEKSFKEAGIGALYKASDTKLTRNTIDYLQSGIKLGIKNSADDILHSSMHRYGTDVIQKVGNSVYKYSDIISEGEVMIQRTIKESLHDYIPKLKKVPIESRQLFEIYSRKLAIDATSQKKLYKQILNNKNLAHSYGLNPTQLLSDLAKNNNIQILENATKRKIIKGASEKYLEQKIKKTLLYKRLTEILAKGPIRLTDKLKKDLLNNPEYLRNFIKNYTGDKKQFQEFFIRLAMEDKDFVKQLFEIPYIKEYIKKAIRAGGVHEWLLTQNFLDFLVNPKWGKDGPFLALALTEFVQKTNNVLFKKGGGHVSSKLANSSASAKFHNDLAELISKCNSKEEILITIKKYAKETLTSESYKEFVDIFNKVFKTIG